MSASTSGDLNGDGYSDLVIGAPLHDDVDIDEGRVFVYYGSAQGLTTASVQELLPPAGTNLRLNFGESVTCLGDVDGDGFDDLAVGAPNHDGPAGEDAGLVAVYFGAAAGLSPVAHPIFGQQADAHFGGDVSGVGDVNGDGRPDLLVGERFFSDDQAGEGRVVLYFGSTDGFSTASWSAEGNAPGIRFGEAVSGAGDVNADGFADLLVCASRFTNGEISEGKAYLFLGGPSGPGPNPSWTMEGNQDNATFGTSLANAGDVDGDGFADVLIGSRSYDHLFPNEGMVLLFLGNPSGLGNPARVYYGAQEGAALGAGAGTAGDVNGDGFADFILGAHAYDGGVENEGRVYLYLGRPQLSTVPDFVFERNVEDALFGAEVGTAGDVNGDGFSDIFATAPRLQASSAFGSVEVYHGAAGFLRADPDQTLLGQVPHARFGEYAAIVGDVNADGYCDAVVVAPFEPLSDPEQSGEARLFYGSAIGLGANAIRLSPLAPGMRFIAEPAAVRDVNGDGIDDFAVAGQVGTNFTIAVFAGGSTQVSLLARIDLGPAVGTVQVSGGDLNGDGYGDILAGNSAYTGNFNAQGLAAVYYGSRAGFDTQPDWQFSGRTLEQVGIDVCVPGDVNADGYDDILVSQVDRIGGPQAEGRVSLWLGSEAGIFGAPVWTISGSATQEMRGRVVAGAGDVDADGFADVLIGTSSASRAEVFHGAPNGLEATPRRTLVVDPSQSDFGETLTTAGDLDLDGFSDIAIADPNDGDPSRSRLFVYRGTPTGIGPDPEITIETPQPLDIFAAAVSGGGDVNGDGFPDLLISIPNSRQSGVQHGSVLVHFGGEFDGVDRSWRSRTYPHLEPIGVGGRTGDPDRMNLVARLRTPAGRHRVGLSAEFGRLREPPSIFIDPQTLLDSGPPQSGVGSVVTAGIVLPVFPDDPETHFRVCLRSSDPYFPRSPWMTLQANGPRDTKVRFLEILPVADAPSVDRDVTALRLELPSPNPIDREARIAFFLPAAGRLRLELLDVSGRRIASLLDEERAAGHHLFEWKREMEEAGKVASGIYFLRVSAGAEEAVRKVMLR